MTLTVIKGAIPHEMNGNILGYIGNARDPDGRIAHVGGMNEIPAIQQDPQMHPRSGVEQHRVARPGLPSVDDPPILPDPIGRLLSLDAAVLVPGQLDPVTFPVKVAQKRPAVGLEGHEFPYAQHERLGDSPFICHLDFDI
jgi:hypothetical protein